MHVCYFSRLHRQHTQPIVNVLVLTNLSYLPVCHLTFVMWYSELPKRLLLLVTAADSDDIDYYDFFFIEFLTSQLWLGNIHLSWDAVINRIMLGGLICSLKSFLQLNMCQELQILAAVYMYWGAS